MILTSLRNLKMKMLSIVGRRDQIKKALFNLIKNAIEAMAGGGTLIIEQYEDLHEITS